MNAFGIPGIIIGFIVASAMVTLITGELAHWLAVIGGIIVGLRAVQAVGN